LPLTSRQSLLDLAVLLIELLQPAQLRHAHAADLLLPGINRCLRDPDLATDLLNRVPNVSIVQCKSDLLLGELALLHGELSFEEFARIL
jgi:hypothetical protein